MNRPTGAPRTSSSAIPRVFGPPLSRPSSAPPAGVARVGAPSATSVFAAPRLGAACVSAGPRPAGFVSPSPKPRAICVSARPRPAGFASPTPSTGPRTATVVSRPRAVGARPSLSTLWTFEPAWTGSALARSRRSPSLAIHLCCTSQSTEGPPRSSPEAGQGAHPSGGWTLSIHGRKRENAAQVETCAALSSGWTPDDSRS